MLENLPEVPKFGCWSNTKYFIGNDGMRTLNNLKLEHDSEKPSRGGYRLQKWQQEQKNKETKRKEDKEQKPWDEDMALVPKIMPSFKEWMRKDATKAVSYTHLEHHLRDGIVFFVDFKGHGMTTSCLLYTSKFFDRWKKRSFEEKMDDLSQTVLTENNIKDPKQVEQYVVERLEQMIDITREIEEEKSEYRTVTSLSLIHI